MIFAGLGFNDVVARGTELLEDGGVRLVALVRHARNLSADGYMVVQGTRFVRSGQDSAATELNFSTQRLDSNWPLEDPGDGLRAPDNTREEEEADPPHLQVNLARSWQSFVSQLADKSTLTEYDPEPSASESAASPRLRNLTNNEVTPLTPRPGPSVLEAINSSFLVSDATQSPPSNTATSILIPIEITSPSKYVLSKVEYRRRRSRSEGDFAPVPMQVDTQEIQSKKRNREQANLTGDGSTAGNIVLNIDQAAITLDTELDLATPVLPRLRPLPGRAQRNSAPVKKKSKP